MRERWTARTDVDERRTRMPVPDEYQRVRFEPGSVFSHYRGTLATRLHDSAISIARFVASTVGLAIAGHFPGASDAH